MVVPGITQRPFPCTARKASDATGIPQHDIDYGRYRSGWRRRSTLKTWTGWPTPPMEFVKGLRVDGADGLAKLIASGELKRELG